ncbi:MAG: hypothetical protein LBJ61_01610, partial [Deltaproteobacteria bacterium]|nr:hypothetical protein [Deltaproteobacteria bacterium]
MAGVTKAYLNGRYRLLRTFSFRDANNKPQNNKKIIGTFDPVTNKIIFNSYFKTLMEQQNVTFDMINSIEWKKIPDLINFGTLSPDHKT